MRPRPATPGQSRACSGRGHWILFSDAKLPSGDEYDVVEYGLFEAPRLSLVSLE